MRALESPPPQLLAEIAAQSGRASPEGTELLAAELQARFGDSLLAIILYGSCLRMQQLTEGVVDLYVIVNRYRDAYPGRSLRYLNAWLPPNVFYMETAAAGTTIRAKYAVISAYDLQRGCTRWFHSYIWSRFAQPARLVYARDTAVRERVIDDFAHALLAFLETTLPVLGEVACDTRMIWENGLGLTYAAELRPERHTRARDITQQNLADFTALTGVAVPALTGLLQRMPDGDYRGMTPPGLRRRALLKWRLRRWQGLFLSVLRLIKAACTFRDGVDYAAWKIERHTGVRITVTPLLRRHPVLFGFSVLWRLIKRDVMH